MWNKINCRAFPTSAKLVLGAGCRSRLPQPGGAAWERVHRWLAPIAGPHIIKPAGRQAACPSTRITLPCPHSPTTPRHPTHIHSPCFPALRSFAVVIQQLPPELRDAICVFYLVLRALDTVEDDMALPEVAKQD